MPDVLCYFTTATAQRALLRALKATPYHVLAGTCEWIDIEDLVEICPRPRVLHIAPAIVCGEDGYRPAYLRLCANLFYFGGRQKIPPPAVPERRSMGPLEPFLGTNIFLIYRN